jgi:hypothetical protein
MRTAMNDSTEMDMIVAFLQRYVAADHEADVGQYLDRDPAEFRSRTRRLEDFFEDARTGIATSLPEFDDEDREIFRDTAQSLVTRRVFKVKRWIHPVHGSLYQGYIGSPAPAATSGYLVSLVIKKISGDFKIVGRYAACLACFATGQYDGKRCPDCSAPGWDFREGLNLTSFGDAQETSHLEAPTNPAFLPEYESDLDLDREERS